MPKPWHQASPGHQQIQDWPDVLCKKTYRKVSNIRRNKSQILNASRLIL